ncbi:MAG: pantetheine-phosphate adenylyltransferase [Phycisphaerae bacterium]|nr:MAG: pantetheine-phosphate adenylyltransferase [Planctomycetota bacterium]KAB2949311.1 MAG: pantetheine-phosphate adenylyltransferase [Phycisphaerae bacterium]MBE7455313.1 pantetheine-phosphate adenylyltransferase [Planctomycetia bacterium]MCK6464125.1 pantetheine-phosphate adenylyltransferase [Phycisphaerae bacterium]MCL4717701.1 pantetheine-phosphate adenylyltransferase [Phycisphaerae bacterium]
MPDSSKSVGMFPGTFDPVTYGHLDIIERAARMYARLIVAVGHNPEKASVFTAPERVEMLRAQVSHLTNVEVRPYEGLTARFARDVGAGVIVRGIRDNVDLHAELELANTNMLISDIETVFLMASSQHAMTSSTLIKQIVEIGGYDTNRLARLVPLEIARRLEDRIRRLKGEPPPRSA